MNISHNEVWDSTTGIKTFPIAISPVPRPIENGFFSSLMDVI